MKPALFTCAKLLLSLAVHVGALNQAALQSVDIPFTVFARHATADVNLLPKRILQAEDLKCPICDRVGGRLLPEPEPECEKADKNYESYIPFYLISNQLNDPCRIHQDAFEELCCDISWSLPPHECEANVKSAVLSSSYDASTVPRASRRELLNVDTLIRFYAVAKIDLAESIAEIFIDLTLTWKDPRLAWDVSSDNCTTSILVRASLDKEKTSIWVPGFDLISRNIGVQSFADTPAKVYSDGSVVWVRSGRVSAFCKFVGLRRIPFDTLGCQFTFGDTFDQRVNYIPFNDTNGLEGIIFANYTQTYAEYTIVKDKTKSKKFGTTPFLLFDFYFERSRRHYVTLIILPTIFFVYISFGQFFFDSASGERVSFVLNVLLIVVAQNIITAELLPLCKESLWLHNLTTASMFVVLIGLFVALLIYTASGKESRGIKKDPFQDGEFVHDNDEPTSLIQNNDESPSFDPKLSSEASRANIHPAFLGRTGKKLRVKLLKIMTWVDFVAKFAFPFSFTVYLIVMVARNKYLDDAPDEINNYF